MASQGTSNGLAPVILNGHADHDEKHEEVPPRLSSSPAPLTDDEAEEGVGEQSESVATDDEEEDEEDDEEEEDEDEEPSLKYERIGGSLPDLLKKDSGSAITVCNKHLAMATHAGIIHILDLTGKRIKSYKPHLASVVDISFDETGDFVATASIDGQVVVHSLSTPEAYAFDMKRPMRTVAMEPNFARRSTRAVVYGGLAGTLVLREKGWLGHKETTLHTGEGPIWQVRWRSRLIAWANDQGVKIYDTVSQTRITYIDRPPDSPRADLFKCTLYWQDDSTLLIAWADHIKVARIRARPRINTTAATANLPPFVIEITAALQVDCMISGVVPHPTPIPPVSISPLDGFPSSTTAPQTLTSFLIIAYSPPETFVDEMTEDRARQARKAAERPELRIISRAGEELAADALSIADYQHWGCNDYSLAVVGGTDESTEGRSYVILSPKDLVIVKPRDKMDHVKWLVERRRYEEALEEVEKIEAEAVGGPGKEALDGLSVLEIGKKYMEYLVNEGDFLKAAKLTPKVCAHDPKIWEGWIFVFADKRQLQAIIPFVPTEHPRLDHVVYEMMLAHFLTHNRQMLLQTIKEWPWEIYDIPAVIVAIRAELDKSASTSTSISSAPSAVVLMECLAELYTANRQPGKALPFYLRLRRPNVFDLIREHNLFTDVQDQVLLLVEFDHELMEKRKKEGLPNADHSDAIKLLVDNIHSIPIARVVQQLQKRPYYLFLYLDALVEKDPQLVSGFADLQVQMYAEFATPRLIDFLRASNYYNLETAYNECKGRDLVPEMVFLLGRMGNNKKALTLIIERLGDVHRAIDFAKEQSDDDLWEDLLMYSETRPAFIRGLLENIGVEISPIRLIRRIKNGLEIPGLKEALIKILQDFHLQISLLEGCQTIMDGDSLDLSRALQRKQSSGFFLSAKTLCPICSKSLQDTPQSLTLLFLCRHVVHATCAYGGDKIPLLSDPIARGFGGSSSRGITGSIAFESMIRGRLSQGCPVCHKSGERVRV
ncbi:vacuolar assembling protein VPS41 [Laccaria bicolor S238N-H82]|uniref:Vacuolar protein sorting-associated protein 41 n=1 Tax=Laccaria bicolor (strain S238N-H82 / ATCC MYA-4686) TaxID=486041 RepID=B0CZH3_LACBS|nr:vacuolar assembling protein VPS41 [Laccaria bicolor S238N-H82]EDR12623.1 vacuolar assembling protein VPS41 [Laccaria bicolor S238N-H82]|eukprot:XP_001876887.1 vacuolar assembling protein VPS41 [Laccaria bicolor S238N-H82]